MKRRVVLSPEAQSDLLNMYVHIAERSGDSRALAYAQRVRAYCMGFSDFAERGTRRDDLRPNLRVVGFERRISIAFHVAKEVVTIDRILYGGRNLEGIFSPEDE